MDTERAKLALLRVLGQVGVHKREKEKMKQFHWVLSIHQIQTGLLTMVFVFLK